MRVTIYQYRLNVWGHGSLRPVARLLGRQAENRDSIPSRGKDCSLHHYVQSGSGGQRRRLSMGTAEFLTAAVGQGS
jgi:hypothetical protein